MVSGNLTLSRPRKQHLDVLLPISLANKYFINAIMTSWAANMTIVKELTLKALWL